VELQSVCRFESPKCTDAIFIANKIDLAEENGNNKVRILIMPYALNKNIIATENGLMARLQTIMKQDWEFNTDR